MSTTSKHPPETGHKHPPSTREQRGLVLFREGAVSEHGHLFTVRGAGRRYTVSLDRETCTCPDFGKRREACKHLFAVVVYAAKKRCRRPARTTERPARRHDGRTGRPREDRPAPGRGSGPARHGGIAPGRSWGFGVGREKVLAGLERMSG